MMCHPTLRRPAPAHRCRPCRAGLPAEASALKQSAASSIAGFTAPTTCHQARRRASLSCLQAWSGGSGSMNYSAATPKFSPHASIPSPPNLHHMGAAPQPQLVPCRCCLGNSHLPLKASTQRAGRHLSTMPAPMPVLVMTPLRMGSPSTTVITPSLRGSLGHTRGTVNRHTTCLVV